MKKVFSKFEKRELILWIVSVIVVGGSNIVSGKFYPSTFFGTLIGVTALVFLAKGDVWGQVLTVVFSVLYSITSFQFHYYGEMITYLGMSAPIAAMSVVSWLKHPYEKGKNEVKIHHLTKVQISVMIVSAIAVTQGFYYILRMLNTPNLPISTVSVMTSYLASFLMFYRNSYYAVAYAANDAVLIILWILASVEDISYLPMVACFSMFFINDLYGFVSWKRREKIQLKNNLQK